MMTRRSSNRTRILRGATEILDAGPFDTFTVDSLSRHLKMSRSTLYRYFASKERVLDTLVDEVCTRVDATVAPLGTRRDEPADAELARFVDALVAYAEDLPRALAIRPEMLPSSLQARLMVTRVAMNSSCGRILTRAVEQGAMEACDVEAMAAGFVTSVHTVMHTVARRERSASRAEPVRQMAETWMYGLLRGRTGDQRKIAGPKRQ